MPEAPKDVVGALDALRDLLAGADLPAWPARELDLARLTTERERLERRFTLAVAGEFSSGKSYLLNALLGKVHRDPQGRVGGLLAVDINPSTATITELEYAASESATARYPSGRVERIPLDRLERFVAVGKDAPGTLHDATADDDSAPSFVTVGVDSAFLAGGFIVADTPGLASLNPAHRRATLAYLPRTDAVLYLIDTQQPFSEGDAAFLGLIGEHVRTIFIVQTKIDLWRAPESDGRPAWEHARDRIIERASRFAPSAEVFSVSARDYALALLDNDAELRAASGFETLLAALERSLEERAQADRVHRVLGVLAELGELTSVRLRREAALLATERPALSAERERAERELIERERVLARQRDETAKAGVERTAWIEAQGHTLSSELIRSLASAIDVADIERIRDRGRFHILVDAAVGASLKHFADEVAGHVARALGLLEREHPGLRVADAVALRLGGEPGSGTWSRDLASGIASTIVLEVLGKPAVTFVHEVATAFTARPHGTYMKRELGADLAETFLPNLAAGFEALIADIAARIGAVYGDLAGSLEAGRAALRSETLDPIDRALKLADDGAARSLALEQLKRATARLSAIDDRVRALFPERSFASALERGVAEDPDAAPFAAEAYDRGLRPERYRVVVLGALRRGKSSLINAIAGTRLLEDSVGSEARFPIHVRYGERNRAYALDDAGTWNEIEVNAAMAHAALSPVLIEIPWSLPRQLVLVHAPAFDSGDPVAEEVALAAAAAASEVVGLFSRQLSENELSLYARVAELGKPMLLAHTIADNETPAERRTVVELAARYLRERGIATPRIFTVSALDFFEAAQTGRAAAAWNELGALRQTLEAHAETHMQRLSERERRAGEKSVTSQSSPDVSSRPNLRRALDRWLGRSERS
jgi:predicted GTPase